LSEQTRTEVSAVIITYNSADHVADSVTSLEKALAHLDAEILVVDNASGDDTVAIAQESLRRGQVIANDDNLGYASAANIGLRNARGRLTLVMNDDARLEPGAIDRLIEVLDSNERIALVGPRIVDTSHQPTHSARISFPGPGEEWQRILDLIFSRDHKAYPAEDRPMPVRWLIAACVLGETETLRQIGGFNEEFFLYGEDIDLGRRLKELGHLSVTVPDAVCVHVGAVTTSKTYTADARTERQVRGRGVYYRLWLPRWARSLVYLRRAIGIRGQPTRLRLFAPLIVWDGPSLKPKRFPAPLSAPEDAT
jgi:GT2 family glycosyltransferase